jgi:hypothetical protein
MSQVNPFVAAILPSAQTQQKESAEKTSQVRRSQEVRKNAGAHGADTYEHQVESADGVKPVDDDHSHPESGGKRRNQNHKSGKDDAADDHEGQDPHLDLTA